MIESDTTTAPSTELLKDEITPKAKYPGKTPEQIEKLKAYGRAYYRQNKEHCRDLVKQWKERNPDYHRNYYEAKRGPRPPKPVIDYSICPKCGSNRAKKKTQSGWVCYKCRYSPKREKAARARAEKEAIKETARRALQNHRDEQKRIKQEQKRIEDAAYPKIRHIRLTAETIADFHSNITREDSHWLWNGPFGKSSPEFRKISAKRVAYTLTRGEITEGKSIYSTCGNTRCVNPDHLKQAVQEEITGTLAERFHAKFIQGKPDECWLWLGRKNEKGYGKLLVNGKQTAAHRIAYELHHGTIDESLQVHHSCDEPRCVNFGHLSQGNQTKNMREAVERHRVAYGPRNAATRLTTEEVVAIYTRGHAGESRAALAREFGVKKDYIRDIIYGRARIRETRMLQG